MSIEVNHAVEQVPPFKEFAIGVIFRAGRILRRNFNDTIVDTVGLKQGKEIVTESDIEVHNFVQFKIHQQFPDHNFVSEEGEREDNGSEYTWVVDPLDGTLNYSIGNPFFCTSLTLLRGDEPIIAVVYAPLTDEMFVTEKNRTTRLNERDVSVSEEERLDCSVLSFSYFHKDKESLEKLLNAWSVFDQRSRAMRHLGCTTLELAYVAAGRTQASIIAPPLRLWDIAAGKLLVETAGGTITDFCGDEWQGLEHGLIASNGRVHKQVLEVVKDCEI